MEWEVEKASLWLSCSLALPPGGSTSLMDDSAWGVWKWGFSAKGMGTGNGHPINRIMRVDGQRQVWSIVHVLLSANMGMWNESLGQLCRVLLINDM